MKNLRYWILAAAVAVSVTAVGAFDAVGSILVVALMIAPPAAASLLTDRRPLLSGHRAASGGAAAVSGFWVAWWLDASIAGSMATMSGVLFGLAFLLAPERGLVSRARQRVRQRAEFAQLMLTIHLLHHEHTPVAATETREDHLHQHLRWKPDRARSIVDRAVDDGLVRRLDDGRLDLTDAGRARAREGMLVSTPGASLVPRVV